MSDLYCSNCGLVQERAEDMMEKLEQQARKLKRRVRELERAIDETGRVDSQRIAGARAARQKEKGEEEE